ncbi:ribonuclease E/G [Vibrio lentus]|nr:ribonuclease E/G [Vibrio lentus]
MGGIIIIDFIDMLSEEHRVAGTNFFEAALDKRPM